MEQLEGLSNLLSLDLRDTKVTSAGLGHLVALTNLQSLNLGNTAVSEEGFEQLQHALPNCKIKH